MIVALFLVAALILSGAAIGQPDRQLTSASPPIVRATAPAWRDLERALYDYEVTLQGRLLLEGAIQRVSSELQHERNRNEQLSEAESAKRLLRQELDALITREYISGGYFEELVFVLNGSEATQVLWRLGIMEALGDIVVDVVGAKDDVSAEQDRTQARIRRLQGALTTMREQLLAADEAISAAEWVVYIAEINDQADRELDRTGFIEPTEQQWYNLRFCESSGDYTATSANGLFYGAYQFEPRTWRTVGGTGNPAQAPPEEQDARARLLYARRGDQPWPRDYCGRWLPHNR